MLAEAAAGLEQELVDGVLVEQRRRQRVVELLLPEPLQHAFEELAVAAGLGSE